MSRNIVFTFSGTGNSLWAAKELAKALGDCEIVSMGSRTQSLLKGSYDRIGFVYPTYYRGAPARVLRFVSQLNLQKQKDAYLFAIATCGKVASSGNATAQLHHLLQRKGERLSYAAKLDMFSNYVIEYDMRDTVREEAAQSAMDLLPMIEAIKRKAIQESDRMNPLLQMMYQGIIHFTPRMDRNFRVSDACVHCGICEKVCPVENIAAGKEGKRVFKHHCEQCLSCIQNCPVKAIDYKERTQMRKRYVHPDISRKALAALNAARMNER